MNRARWLRTAILLGILGLGLALRAYGAAGDASPDLGELVREIDQLRGSTDPGDQERLLETIAALHAELRHRQGEVSAWIRYWYGFRQRLLTPIFLIGLTGQLLFASRFVVQWAVSVRRGESTIPVAFWYLSIVGSSLVLLYGILSKEPVIILGQLGLFIYLHNLVLIRRAGRRGASATDETGTG